MLYSLPIAGTFKLKQAESLPKGYLLLLREAKKLLHVSQGPPLSRSLG